MLGKQVLRAFPLADDIQQVHILRASLHTAKATSSIENDSKCNPSVSCNHYKQSVIRHLKTLIRDQFIGSKATMQGNKADKETISGDHLSKVKI